MKLLSTKFFVGTLVVILFTTAGCKNKKDKEEPEIPVVQQPVNTTTPAITSNTSVLGYNILTKALGIWNGPVTSTTPLGNFKEWIVDFRPISASQISAKNELDIANSVYMSFFVIYDGSQYKVCFRNGGTFGGMIRTAYMNLDSVKETSSYSFYRFVDFVKKDKRTVAEWTFSADSVHLRCYTNKANLLPAATMVHIDWRAGLQYTAAYQDAKTKFDYPQKTMVKDVTSTFKDVTESIYYSVDTDPYPESEQPYLGQATLSYSIAPSLSIPAAAKLTLMISTQPLFGATGPITANFKTRSRYVILTSPDNSFVFNYMHPGTYYYYALCDKDNNGVINSGDYMSATNTTFTLDALGKASASTQINFQIP
jgi:hypothetical protein